MGWGRQARIVLVPEGEFRTLYDRRHGLQWLEAALAWCES